MRCVGGPLELRGGLWLKIPQQGDQYSTTSTLLLGPPRPVRRSSAQAAPPIQEEPPGLEAAKASMDDEGSRQGLHPDPLVSPVAWQYPQPEEDTFHHPYGDEYENFSFGIDPGRAPGWYAPDVG